MTRGGVAPTETRLERGEDEADRVAGPASSDLHSESEAGAYDGSREGLAKVENVAKMLGHSDIRMTQHYAKVMDSSIKRDMAGIDNCFADMVII